MMIPRVSIIFCREGPSMPKVADPHVFTVFTSLTFVIFFEDCIIWASLGASVP